MVNRRKWKAELRNKLEYAATKINKISKQQVTRLLKALGLGFEGYRPNVEMSILF